MEDGSKMRNLTPDDDYKKEIVCTYKDETYSVRDNGSVMRHPKINGNKRPKDNKWTFGDLKKTGYLEIVSKRVHRIVATAFHGVPDFIDPIVHHIDNNKRNNRPGNLRWVTRLENMILDPIHSKKIALICGSVEAFLANPAKFRDRFNEPNNSWMRAVSEEEGKYSLERWLEWAKSDKRPSGGTVGEWIFQKPSDYSEEKVDEIFHHVEQKTGIKRQDLCSNKAKRGNYADARIYAAKKMHSDLNLSKYQIGNIMGLSSNTVSIYIEVSADRYSNDFEEVKERELQRKILITPESIVQKNWTAASEFPNCPKEIKADPITEFAEQLLTNSHFYTTSYYSTILLDKAVIDSGKTLLTMYEIEYKDRDQKWGIMRISFEQEKFICEIVTNYNGRTLDHYNLEDTENHFNAIIKGEDWKPLYDPQGRKFDGDYLPL